MTNDYDDTVFDELVAAKNEIDRLKAENANLRSMSTIEMMCENLSVKHHVEEWERRCLEAEAENARLTEHHIMCLVGISTASIQNTKATVADRITKDNPYYTQAYEDVCRAIDREMVLRAENARLEAALKGLYGKGLGELLEPTIALLERHITCSHKEPQWNCSACARDTAYRVELARLRSLI